MLCLCMSSGAGRPIFKCVGKPRLYSAQPLDQALESLTAISPQESRLKLTKCNLIGALRRSKTRCQRSVTRSRGNRLRTSSGKSLSIWSRFASQRCYSIIARRKIQSLYLRSSRSTSNSLNYRIVTRADIPQLSSILRSFEYKTITSYANFWNRRLTQRGI